MELLKLLSGNEIIAQIISFLLLLVILRIFLWDRVLKILDARREKIALDLKKIDDAKLDVERLKSDYNRRLEEIEKEAKAKTEEAIAEGRRVAEELRHGAEDDTQRLVENAKATINDELARAKEELRDEIVDITISVAEKVIEEKLTEGADKKIVEEFLKKMEKA